MTAADAAKELGIHHNNVLKALREGWLPGQKFGSRWFVRRTDVLAYKERTSKRKRRVDHSTH